MWPGMVNKQNYKVLTYKGQKEETQDVVFFLQEHMIY